MDPERVVKVKTVSITNISYNSCSVEGAILDMSKSGIDQYGFCWSLTQNPTIENNKTQLGSKTSSGNFSDNLSNLTENSTYFIKAYAKNNDGVFYGEQKTFTTIDYKPPSVATATINSITAYSAQSGGNVTDDGGSPVTARGVCWNTSTSPSISNSKTSDGTGMGSFSSNIAELTPGITYYVRAYATNNVGTAYGSEVTFTTSAGLPTLTTTAISTILSTTAKSGGSIISDGGSTITACGVCWSISTNPTTTDSKTNDELSSGPYTSILTGLTGNTTYHVRAYAINNLGTGYGNELDFTTNALAQVPDAPTGVSATAGYENATITFTAPESDGGSAITGYTVTSSPSGITGTGTISPITVADLTGGTAYTFTVTATNANGTGAASSASNSVTPTTIPGAPTIGTATAGNAQATITFTAPENDGGSPITGYTVTSSPGGITGTGTTSPINVTSLTSGTSYTFTVTATNDNGTGAASSASNSVTPTTIPGAPTIGTATAGNAQATITFTAPENDGGSPITGYTVTSSPGGITGTGTASPITVAGLTSGTSYTFTVTATNDNGTGASSSASNSVTPLLQDIDGNLYNTVTIGTQVWMKENLKAIKYNDGTFIPKVTVDATWGALTTGAYCDYSNTPANSTTYGRLYNWYAVDNNTATKVASNGGKNVCPTGWHIPTDSEWTILENYLISNGYNYDGTYTDNKIAKSLASTTGWGSSTTAGAVGNIDYPVKRNATAFTALPGGYRSFTGLFYSIGQSGHWWSSTEFSTENVWHRYLHYDYTYVSRNYFFKQYGFSVRCLRD